MDIVQFSLLVALRRATPRPAPGPHSFPVHLPQGRHTAQGPHASPASCLTEVKLNVGLVRRRTNLQLID